MYWLKRNVFVRINITEVLIHVLDIELILLSHRCHHAVRENLDL